jgi:nitrite reductase (NADH) small subunit
MAVFYVDECVNIPEGAHKIVEIEGRSIGIYNIKNQFYAIHNYCPHQGVPLCQGTVCGTNLPSNVNEYRFGRDGEILRCPWHGWEFDIITGKSLFDEKVRARSYKVEIHEGKVGIVIGG